MRQSLGSDVNRCGSTALSHASPSFFAFACDARCPGERVGSNAVMSRSRATMAAQFFKSFSPFFRPNVSPTAWTNVRCRYSDASGDGRSESFNASSGITHTPLTCRLTGEKVRGSARKQCLRVSRHARFERSRSHLRDISYVNGVNPRPHVASCTVGRRKGSNQSGIEPSLSRNPGCQTQARQQSEARQ